MRRKTVKNVINILHKGFVYSCLAGTFYGLYIIGLNVDRYFRVVRPQIEEKQMKERELLLSEGKDMLKDVASDLKL